MKIPFIQHIGIGVHISDHLIRWVELSRIGDRIRLRRFDRQEVENQDIEDALQRLVQKTEPDFRYVTVNLNPAQIRQSVIDVPNLDDEEYLDHWVDDRISELIPSSLSRDSFVAAHHFFGEAHTQKSLFAIVRKEAARERKKLLNSAGLEPIGFSAGVLEPGYALLFDEKFVEGSSYLLNTFDGVPSLLSYRDGLPTGYNRFDITGDDITIGDLASEAEAHLAAERLAEEPVYADQSIFVAADILREQTDSPFLPEQFESITLVPVQPLSGLDLNEEDGFLGTDYALASGMAVKQLYPDLDSLNLLEQADRFEAREAIEKKDTIHSGMLMSGMILFLFILVMAVQVIIGNQLEETSAQVAQLEDKITTVRNAREGVEDWKDRVTEARQLVAERTQVASLLENVGRILPEKAWYNEIEVTGSETGNHFNFTLYGFSENEASVAELMDRLEGADKLVNIRLILSEQVAAPEVSDRFDIKNQSLIHFQIRLTTKM